MSFLLLAVVCSVLVSVLLKLVTRYRLDVTQMVATNYAVATVLSLLVLRPSLEALRTPQTPWIALLALAVALPSIFLVLARSVVIAGIVRSDVAQRLSLLLSLAAAFALFGEQANGWKLAGLAVGIIAVAGIASRTRGGSIARTPAAGWPWLLGVWAGFALIDVLLKHIAQSGAPSLSALTACFAIACALMVLWLAWQHLRGRTQLAWRNLGAGALLGVLNFGNILCYVRAHQALPDSPAVVFATMNIGVVVLGALVGMLVFRERTSLLNRIALGLAIVAIVLIAKGTFAT
jgi:drug/metabolite transporter (DMT)-like permease